MKIRYTTKRVGPFRVGDPVMVNPPIWNKHHIKYETHNLQEGVIYYVHRVVELSGEPRIEISRTLGGEKISGTCAIFELFKHAI